MSELNPSQYQAVNKVEGPLMILAGAGSGKTRTLTKRLAHIIEDIGVSPYKVLAMTFSNKAAREMRERVAKLVNADIGALQITTFHSFCANLLRKEATYLGLSRNFTIYDTSESKAVIKNVLGRHGISTKELNPFEVLNFIDDVKNIGYFEGIKEEECELEIDSDNAQYFQFYKEYEAELHKANAVDFGGLICGVLQLFEKFPEVLKTYQDKYDFVLVDEYQDTNRAQFNLLKLLSSQKRNICVVGDEDQSIYSWRGADIRNILDFETEFPEAEVVKLEQNYRSTRNIIEAATNVIARNTYRKGKNMWTDNPEGESVQIVECDSDKTEAEFVMNEIKSLKKEKVRLDDIAVFYRTNSQSRIIEDNLRKLNLPYRVVGGIKFYERKEIKDILAYLRLVVNEKDSLALSRVVNVPARGVGVTSLRKLENEALKNGVSLFEIVENITSNYEDYTHMRLSNKVRSSLTQFCSLITEIKYLETVNTHPSELVEKVIHESGYFDYLNAKKDYETKARLENLEELISAVKHFEIANQNPSLTSFLESITLDSSNENVDSDENTGEISLMTIHGAKGLEFPYVFVVGCEENIFPSYMSMDDGEKGLEEERRLFYVAMTRAMKRLYIMFAQARMMFGQIKFNGPSRFINEIPPKYYEWKKSGKTRSESSYDNQEQWDDDFNQDTYESDNFVYASETRPKYPKGTRVVHGLYGEGLVMDTSGSGNDEKVVILFGDGEKKRFLVKYAPLTLV